MLIVRRGGLSNLVSELIVYVPNQTYVSTIDRLMKVQFTLHALHVACFLLHYTKFNIPQWRSD